MWQLLPRNATLKGLRLQLPWETVPYKIANLHSPSVPKWAIYVERETVIHS